MTALLIIIYLHGPLAGTIQEQRTGLAGMGGCEILAKYYREQWSGDGARTAYCALVSDGYDPSTRARWAESIKSKLPTESSLRNGVKLYLGIDD